jgi:hypothetical protein
MKPAGKKALTTGCEFYVINGAGGLKTSVSFTFGKRNVQIFARSYSLCHIPSTNA